MDRPSSDAEWVEYEVLTGLLVQRLAADAGIETLRVDRDVALPGRASNNRIDVVWDLVDEMGEPARVVFECRSYKRRITQQMLHSWRSVVDDVSTAEVRTLGVMVTRAGYQAGARAVANTYGIVILELREPTEHDLADRAAKITLTINARVPRMTDLRIQVPDDGPEPFQVSAMSTELYVEHDDGRVERLLDVLFDGELNDIKDELTPTHGVVRKFEPPVTVRNGEAPVCRAVAVGATVGEHATPPVEVTVGGLDGVAWMMRDALSGDRLWFSDDGPVWKTDN